MVSQVPKEVARASFATWFSRALDDAGVVQGRGRAPAVAKRYKVSTTAARKWLTAEAMPDSARLLQIVQDLDGKGAATDQVEAIKHVIVTAETIEEAGGTYTAHKIAPSEIPTGYVRLPLLAMEASMGDGAYSDEPLSVVRHMDVAEWWAAANLPRPYSRIQIITGRGDSMAGVINHGDIVFVDTAIDHFDGDGLYVFNWHGRALIKRLVSKISSGKLLIVSANPAYPPEEVDAGEIDQLHISGRVAAWYTLRNH